MEKIISLIVAHSTNRVIGKNNTLLWKIRDDMKLFKSHTVNKTIIMGRKTFESLGSKPLPNRQNIIVSKTMKQHTDLFNSSSNVLVTDSIESAIELAVNDVFIIGGGEIYKYCLGNNLLDYLFVSEIDVDIVGDTYFPNIDDMKYKLISKIPYNKNEHNEYSFNFCIYAKIL